MWTAIRTNEVSCSGTLCDGAVVWQNGDAFQSGSVPDSLEVTDQDDSDLVWVLLFKLYIFYLRQSRQVLAWWALLLLSWGRLQFELPTFRLVISPIL